MGYQRKDVETLFPTETILGWANLPDADILIDILDALDLPIAEYDPTEVTSYLYLWINFDHLRAGKYPFLYIGSRRFIGDPERDTYKGTNKDLNRDQGLGLDCQRFILATWTPSEEIDTDFIDQFGNPSKSYEIEDAVLKGIGVRRFKEFYNWSEDGAGLTSDGARAIGTLGSAKGHEALRIKYGDDWVKIISAKGHEAMRILRKNDPEYRQHELENMAKAREAQRNTSTTVRYYLLTLEKTFTDYNINGRAAIVKAIMGKDFIKQLEVEAIELGLDPCQLPDDNGPELQLDQNKTGSKELPDQPRWHWLLNDATSLIQTQNRFEWSIFEQRNPNGIVAKIQSLGLNTHPEEVRTSLAFFDKWGNRTYGQDYSDCPANGPLEHSIVLHRYVRTLLRIVLNNRPKVVPVNSGITISNQST